MLNIVVALAEEARPLIRHFRLKRYHHVHPFQVYGNEDIQLIVSGIGKMAAATATAFLAGLSHSSKLSAWLNIGIAGGNAASAGGLVLAHQIIDDGRKQQYYPALCFDFDAPSASVVSVDQPRTEYHAGQIYDMEASGFFSAAMRFSTAELIHCAKIISDNDESSISNISGKQVVLWIEQNLDRIFRFSEILLNLLADLEKDFKGEAEHDYLLHKFHFTQTQQTQLRSLLQGWYSVSDVPVLEFIQTREIPNAQALLRVLASEINAKALHF